jgi:hypothetical protein
MNSWRGMLPQASNRARHRTSAREGVTLTPGDDLLVPMLPQPLQGTPPVSQCRRCAQPQTGIDLLMYSHTS